MLQVGEEKIARLINVYYLEVLLGILPPIIIGIVLFGLNIIGLMTTTGATTELPPLINYLPYAMAFVLSSFVVKEALPGLVVSLTIVHALAFVHVIIFITIPTWKLVFACVSQAIACDGFYTILHIVMFLVTLVLTVVGFTTLISMVTLSQSISQYLRYSMADYGTFREITGDSINTLDEAGEEEEKEERKMERSASKMKFPISSRTRTYGPGKPSKPDRSSRRHKISEKLYSKGSELDKQD